MPNAALSSYPRVHVGGMYSVWKEEIAASNISRDAGGSGLPVAGGVFISSCPEAVSVGVCGILPVSAAPSHPITLS